MTQDIGPVCRICRRFSEKLFLKGDKCLAKCTLEKRHSPPGEHVMRRRRASERGLQLKEKQKARFIYFVRERQFRRYFAQAKRQSGLTGENLLRTLEMRLDNVAYRLGFAESRRAARQLVSHGHLTVNGRKLDIPSALLKAGDVVAWKPEAAAELHRQAQERAQGRYIPPWLTLDVQALSGRVGAPPSPGDLDVRIEGKMIVEYYAR